MDFLSKKVDRLQLVVFDLDYTLWPFWVDTHVTPPFKRSDDGKVYDCHRVRVKYFPDVPAILQQLQSLGYQLAIASRTSCPEEANQLLRLFDWDKYFNYKEIYPGTKTTHINRIAKQSGVQLSDILFFDDESRNIRDLTAINVKSILVQNGVNFDVIRKGIESFVSTSNQ